MANSFTGNDQKGKNKRPNSVPHALPSHKQVNLMHFNAKDADI